MKIVITASGPTVDAEVDPRFARAPWFAIFDTDSGEVEFKDNSQNMQAAHGAGIQAGSTVADLGASVVITGDCGPKATTTLEAAGIEIITGATGTVQEAYQKFLEDRADT